MDWRVGEGWEQNNPGVHIVDDLGRVQYAGGDGGIELPLWVAELLVASHNRLKQIAKGTAIEALEKELQTLKVVHSDSITELQAQVKDLQRGRQVLRAAIEQALKSTFTVNSPLEAALLKALVIA